MTGPDELEDQIRTHVDREREPVKAGAADAFGPDPPALKDVDITIVPV